MSIFCTIFGHTWVPHTIAPTQRWHTTKEGQVLVQDEVKAGEIRHLDRCARCGSERNAGPRRHDGDVADVGVSKETG